MRLTLIAAAVSLAISTAACQKTVEDNAADTAANNLAMNDTMMDDSMANDMNTNGMAMAPALASDFVATIAASDMFEIASGKLAQSMATKEECKNFGTMLVADHGKSTADLKTAAAAATPPVTLPTGLPAELQAKLDALKAAKAAKGAEFDKLFIEQQKDGHKKALEALKSYASGGDVASLKAFATKGAPVVQAHLDEINAMKI